jgi:YegS/Rv2252/BmrU family lipid kinase
MNLSNTPSSPKPSGLILWFFISGLLVIAITVYAKYLASMAVSTAQLNIKQRMLLVSELAGQLLPEADLKEFENPLNRRKMEYIFRLAELKEFSKRHNISNIFYIIRNSSNKYQYIIGVNSDPGKNLTPDSAPGILSQIEGLNLAFAGQNYVSDQSSIPEPPLGWLMVLRPVLNAKREIWAVAGVEIEDEDLVRIQQMRQVLNTIQFVLLSFFMLIGFYCFWIYKKIYTWGNFLNLEKTILFNRLKYHFQGPLGVIADFTHSALSEELPQETKDSIGRMKNSAQELLAVINDTLTLIGREDVPPSGPENRSVNNADTPPYNPRPAETVSNLGGTADSPWEAQKSKHLFIVNPVSFWRRSDMEAVILDIETTLRNNEVNDYDIYISKFPRAAIGKIREMANDRDNKPVRVYAVGGDGILFDCLNGIIGLENADLAAIPYGNSNDFVRSFGENKEKIFRDINLQIQSSSVAVDVIYCGHNYALNTCTIGLEALTVHKAMELNARYNSFRDKYGPRVRKLFYNWTFFWSGVISAFTNRIIWQNYTITLDDSNFCGDYTGINIANGPCYGGDKNAAIAAMPNDGLLDVLLFKSTGRLNVLRMGISYIYGKYHLYPAYISYIRGREITVRSKDPLVMQLDGEIFLDTNITAKIIPAAVRIVAPRGLSFHRRAQFNG